MNYPNIYTLFRERVEQYRWRNVFYFRKDESWQSKTWNDFENEVFNFGCALLAKGLTPKASVCILMGNVPEWAVCDIATISVGGIGVGLYPTSSAEQCAYIINHSDAEFVVVDTKSQLEKILGEFFSKVKAFIVLDETAADVSQNIFSYKDFLAIGRENREKFLPVLQERGAGAKADDIAIMVYTSGTTGLPKGACLSHKYIINSVESLRETIPIYDTDVCFSYLPFCHVAERISGFYNRLYAGTAVHFVDDLSKLLQYMNEIKPTVFASLPRFFEKIHARAIADAEQLNDEERKQFFDALEVGKKVVRLQQERKFIPSDLQSDYEDNALPVLRRVKNYFGRRIRLATSGGAPLPQEVAEFFAAVGLPILQAYGLTENICVAFNRADNYKFGTVGPPMPRCEIKIMDDGEILVRSEMMFSGYYKEPNKTAEMFRDGWLLTGDIGEQNEEGFLKITGRKKELIVLSTGKNIAPALLENLIKEHHLISQAFIYGDEKSYLVALITLNPTEAEMYARSHNIAFENFAELTGKEEIKNLVAAIIEKVNARVSSSEQIKKYLLLERDFQIELDEVTPTLKLKRNIITKKFKELLMSLYENN
jgi:long-chain acyl-CoA synthetase